MAPPEVEGVLVVEGEQLPLVAEGVEEVEEEGEGEVRIQQVEEEGEEEEHKQLVPSLLFLSSVEQLKKKRNTCCS